MNLDIVVRMHCEDLHVNVQDATGDLIKAGDLLSKDQTNWKQWGRAHKLKETYDKNLYGEEDEDVHDYLGAARRGKRKFSKTPRLRGISDSCRIYGSMEENKVKGDFHITARGHGYISWENHLDHSRKSMSSSWKRQLMSSVQLYSPYQRTIFWSILSKVGQSSRRYDCEHRYALLQVPILRQYRPNNLHHRRPPSTVVTKPQESS